MAKQEVNGRQAPPSRDLPYSCFAHIWNHVYGYDLGLSFRWLARNNMRGNELADLKESL